MSHSSKPASADIVSSEATSSIPCAICRRQFSRYTCPRCNMPYCSLTCFRSETHAECSESFYRKEIESDVRGDASKTVEQRKKTLELLKHFEEDSMNDDIFKLSADEDGDDDNDLASRLAGLDVESASYGDIWDALTLEERERFQRALHDPDGELAQQLLASEELEKDRIEPWWEASDDLDTGWQSSTLRAMKRYGKQPEMMQVPPHMASTPPTPRKYPLLLYNLCAILLAYAYVTRHFARSPVSELDAADHAEARRVLSTLVPFLADRTARTALPSLSGAVTDVWSRLEPGSVTPALFSILLRDAAALLRPSSIVELAIPTLSSSPSANSVPTDTADLSSHPSARTLRALSDLVALFVSAPGQRTRPNHVAHKLAFYAAHVLGVPPVLLHTLAGEAAERAERVAKEGVEASVGAVDAQEGGGAKAKNTATHIVELS